MEVCILSYIVHSSADYFYFDANKNVSIKVWQNYTCLVKITKGTSSSSRNTVIRNRHYLLYIIVKIKYKWFSRQKQNKKQFYTNETVQSRQQQHSNIIAY